MNDFLSDFIFEVVRFVLMGGLMVLGAFIGISLRKWKDSRTVKISVVHQDSLSPEERERILQQNKINK